MFAQFVLDRDHLRASGVPLTLIVGEENRGTWFDEAATWLIGGTGANRVELPGGHAGFLSQLEAFAGLVSRIATLA